MHNGERSRGEYCRVLLVRLYTRRLLSFFLASGAPQEQVCAVVLYSALSLSNAIPIRIIFLSLPPFCLFSTLLRFQCSCGLLSLLFASLVPTFLSTRAHAEPVR